MTDSTPDDALYMARIRANLANQNTDAARAQVEHAPRQWSATEEAEFIRKNYGSDEDRIAKLIRDANDGKL
ncbi:hypothetical protein [Microbacterium sp. NPDC097977]|uniref:hypothetical protein n=1 Tax=Microbacterium sp. NPDC097977 TaxID=3155686 RepID=UPI00331AAEEE